ncbi:MAG TPA: TonB-dependent receptor [Steroidobacteraceae bacterium]|nr:TonB-dependent receptor [Steroidobacteraceae bacterium]
MRFITGQRLRFSTVALACLFSVTAAGAQPAEEQELDSVYVYGRSLEATLPQELAEYGSDLVSLGRSSIEQNVYADPQQALQMDVPGLYITPAGPFSYSYVSIQGSRLARYGPSDVLWLVDGVRLNNRLYSSTLSDTLPANMVERIEVLKGGESLFYGTNAAGGVINIVSRDFSDSFGGDASFGGDSNGGYAAAGMVRGSAGPGRFVLFGSKDESDGYKLWNVTEPSATDRRQSYDVFNVGAKYGLDITQDLALVAQYQHTEGDIDNIRPVLTSSSVNSRNEEIASIRLDYAPAQGTQFFLKGYYHDWDTRYTTIENVPGSPGATDVVDDNLYWGYEDYGINALAKFRPSRGGMEYLLGYDFQRYNAEDQVWQIDPETESVHAVFAQVRTARELIRNGAISAGVRYNDTGGTSATVWNLSGKYDLAGGYYLQGSVSTNFILPNAEQLFLNDCCEVGNPDLAPEETTNFNASVGAVQGRHYWQATGFWRKVDDIIGIDFEQPAYPDGIFENMGEARIRGFELLGGLSLTDSLRAEASYTHVRARIDGQDRQMDYNPRDQAKASLTLDRGQFGGSLAARWTGDVAARVNDSFGVVPFGDVVVTDLSAYFYFDRDRRHQIAARVENLFDEDYVTLVGYRSFTPDGGGPAFLAGPRGVPRTLHATYRFRF